MFYISPKWGVGEEIVRLKKGPLSPKEIEEYLSTIKINNGEAYDLYGMPMDIFGSDGYRQVKATKKNIEKDLMRDLRDYPKETIADVRRDLYNKQAGRTNPYDKIKYTYK